MKTMSVQDFQAKLKKGEVTLIDVREPFEYRAESIEGACLIPLREISIERLPTRTGTIVIHCRSGKRSRDACERLLKQDPSLDVYSLEGGIVAWGHAGYETKKSGSSIIPIERQTFIVAGVLILSGITAGMMVDAMFFILPIIVGCGLLFGGITGWCGMSMLLARMPWNQ